MARVYKAYDPEINRPLAIKLLKAQLRLDGEYHGRFLREAKGAGVLSHPNIVTVFDVGEDQGHPYIAMEFVEGRRSPTEFEGEQGDVDDGRRRDRHPANAGARLRAQEGHRPPRREARQHHAAKRHATRSRWPTSASAASTTANPATRRSRRKSAACSARPTTCRLSRCIGEKVDSRSDLFSAGCRALSAPHRPPALRGRHADQRRLQDHQDRSAVARQGAPATCRLSLRRVIERALKKQPDKRFQTARSSRRRWSALRGSSPRVTEKQGAREAFRSPCAGR